MAPAYHKGGDDSVLFSNSSLVAAGACCLIRERARDSTWPTRLFVSPRTAPASVKESAGQSSPNTSLTSFCPLREGGQAAAQAVAGTPAGQATALPPRIHPPPGPDR